jgi:hypothetical protein
MQALIALQIARLEKDLNWTLARLPDRDRLHELHTISMGSVTDMGSGLALTHLGL